MVAERRRSRREAEIKVYFQTGSAVLCVEHVRRAGRCCTSSVAAAALGMGHMGQGGLGTVLGWLVGWCDSVADPISQDQVQYVLRAIGL